MDQPNPHLLDDVHYLRDLVERTKPPAVNHYWSISLLWGCVITFAYMLCAWLAAEGYFRVMPWVWPVLLVFVAWPLHWYLARRVRLSMMGRGIRPRFRKDLAFCWGALTLVGFLWSAALVKTGIVAGQWYPLSFLWCSLYFVGYIVNGVLLSSEWLWAAGALLASVLAVAVAGPAFYWCTGLWIGGTFVLAGLLGRRAALRRAFPE